MRSVKRPGPLRRLLVEEARNGRVGLEGEGAIEIGSRRQREDSLHAVERSRRRRAETAGERHCLRLAPPSGTTRNAAPQARSSAVV